MANEPTIEQQNEAIAVFCGYKVYDEGLARMVLNEARLGWPVSALRYHESWSWLMPVVQKIQKLKIIDFPKKKPVMAALMDVDIKIIHQAVYDFITWLNQQKQKDG